MKYSAPVKIVYFFMSQGAAPTGSIASYKPTSKCGEQYNDFNGEGTFKLLQKLHDNGVIDDLRVFYESARDPGIANWIPGVYCSVIPEIRFAEQFIKENSIIFVRGGFRTWHDFLVQYKHKNWLMLYAANTGRQRWTWWDVILNDCDKINDVDKFGRYWHFFIKPTDESLFYPKCLIEKKYDLCIGASHIHDKKGQWRTINMLIEYKKRYGKNLKCIMPGAPRRGVETGKIREKISNHGLDVEIVGKVSRHKLCSIFNRSRFFIHLGTHGQNDRGPIEALACGTPLIIGSPSYHSPILYENPEITFVPKDVNDLPSIAAYLRRRLPNYHIDERIRVHGYYMRYHSFERTYNRFQFLIELMANSKPTIESKINLLHYFNGEENGR